MNFTKNFYTNIVPRNTIGLVDKMSEAKHISKNLFIITLIVCITVSIVLSGILVTYLAKSNDLEAQIFKKDQQIAAFNSTIYSVNSQIANLQADLTQANDQITSLQEILTNFQTNYQTVLDDYLGIINLAVTDSLFNNAVLSQTANQTSTAFLDQIKYAGYMYVYIESNSTTTYAQIIYDEFGVNFNQKITIGEVGSASFPVLPGELEILIGNEETIDSVSGYVTISYVY